MFIIPPFNNVDPSSLIAIGNRLLLIELKRANQGVTDWRFWGIKKLHELPEVLESQLKSSQKNILKISSHTLISSTTIKDSFKPEYYSVYYRCQRRLLNVSLDINKREEHMMW